MIAACVHLAWRYVDRHLGQTLLLAAALGLVLALPLSIRVIVRAAETAMRARADSTPQVIGGRGSALDLLLSALYFKRQPLPALTVKTLDEVRSSKLGTAIPLYTRFHSQEAPIVGTSLDYFPFRKLSLKEGRMFGRLGDCVIGAGLANKRGLGIGDHIFSSQEQVFDLAGIYPLKMRITGILAASGTSDDEAVFADLKTTWLIEGLAHGHDDLVSDDAILKKEDGNVIGNASVRMFNQVTDKNLSGFHFHGDTHAYPLSSILINPTDAKAEAILAGRYQKSDHPAQIIRPLDEFQALMGTLFQVESLAHVILALLALAAGSVAVLVFALTFRLRKREFATLDDLGISRNALVLTKGMEVILVTIMALFFAMILTSIVWLNADKGVSLMLRL
ncbi:putative ABC transport system permease protein [Prosthecobacter fusiformis]|uniref:Putative ABC transport system permease protein n=1 Tax=Prosthecobacter fusiformis TaxID=48464 RepID=A0A4R7S615_9BACT|nr:ABC transporter permease [Prosthecobacter fusiformis]TDU73329.1 putative ABC transport system permease protein [Prosthecobacter fusiformis]